MDSKRYTISLTITADNNSEGKAKLESILKFAGVKQYEIKSAPESRTTSQNSALHLYLTMLEEECRNMGATMDMIIKKPQQLPITRHLLKDLFRLYGKTMFGKDSTSKLEKNEFSEVLMTFQKVVAERLGLSLPFPSIENFLGEK